MGAIFYWKINCQTLLYRSDLSVFWHIRYSSPLNVASSKIRIHRQSNHRHFWDMTQNTFTLGGISHVLNIYMWVLSTLYSYVILIKFATYVKLLKTLLKLLKTSRSSNQSSLNLFSISI